MANMVSSALVELPTKPHALYRFYDRTDVLLYVGITVNLPSRLGDHRRDKPWWLEVAYVRVQHFPTRDEALKAEAAAIRTEGPLHNDSHNEKIAVPPEDRRQGRRDLANTIVDTIISYPGAADRFYGACVKTAGELDLPEDLRQHSGESDQTVITALRLAEQIASDVARFAFAAEELLKRLPPGLVANCEGEAAADWQKAGEPYAMRIDHLPDILRHLGYALRDHFQGVVGVERVNNVP